MVTESLGFGATSLLSPLLQGWRNAVAYQLLGIQQLFPRRGERLLGFRARGELPLQRLLDGRNP